MEMEMEMEMGVISDHHKLHSLTTHSLDHPVTHSLNRDTTVRGTTARKSTMSSYCTRPRKCLVGIIQWMVVHEFLYFSISSLHAPCSLLFTPLLLLASGFWVPASCFRLVVFDFHESLPLPTSRY
jgi:hypothetical protein